RSRASSHFPVVARSLLGTALLLGSASTWALGEPLFSTPFLPFDTGDYPVSVVVADLDSDGRPDVTTANLNSNSVSVLLGNGNGTFAAKTDFGTGVFPQSVAIGDVNADGRPDLATANSASNTVSVLLGNGDGTFRGR